MLPFFIGGTMARVVQHKFSENKRLFDYYSLAEMDDCDELIVCLSERSLNIILNSMTKIEEFRTRLYVSREDDFYTLANDSQFEDYRIWVGNVYNELGSYIMCNEKLERIAVALETMVQAQDEQTIDLFDVLEALGLDPTEEEADILEALDYMLNLPGFDILPNFKIPKLGFISSYMEGRYRSAHLQLLRDIAISQRGQTVAQGGLDFASLFDTMGETADSLLVKAGYAGKAYWIWRWISNDQIPGWLGWLSTISGAVLGSIRDATYKVRDAIEAIDLTGIEDAIRESTDTTIVNCNNCTASELYSIINDDATQGAYAVVQNDSGWTDTGSPPVSDDTTWEEPVFPDSHKCQAARYILGWLMGFYGHEDWALSTSDNTLTLAEKIKGILADIPPIGVALNALSVIIGRVLSYLSSGSTDVFVTLNEVLVDLEEQLVCAIYTASGPDEAREAFIAILNDDGRLSGFEQHFLNVFLTLNNVMALPFYSNPEVEPFIDSFGTECDCEEFSVWWSCMTNDETGYADGGSDWVEVDALPIGANYLLSIGYASLVDWNVEVTSGSFTSPSSWPSDFNYAADEASSTACGSGNGYGWTVISSTWDLTPTNKKVIQYVSGDFFRMKFTRIDP